MGTKSKRQHLEAIRPRYRRAGKRYKTKILDEFCAVCGYHRKYAIRLLRRSPPRRCCPPAPKPKYDHAVRAVLKLLWLATDPLCSKRLKVALPLWLPYHEQTHGPLEPTLRTKLLAASPATLDRLLRPVRARLGGKGLGGTQPGRLLRQHIPIRTDSQDLTVPGHLEADAVAHCGNSLAGDFVWSLTFTDIFSQWTENRAVWNRGAHAVLAQVRQLEQSLPFPLLSFDSDNGAEFLNHHLWRYFLDRPQPVAFVRRRPYHKNDQAHVEQNNWTRVRQLLGYDRFGEPALAALVNDLYRTAWDPLQNFFCPSMKLAEKKRVGARYVKKYDAPQTPYQRLLASPHVSAAAKAHLQQQFAGVNPFGLKKEVERQLKMIFDQLRRAAP
jgi:hypothetical protein